MKIARIPLLLFAAFALIGSAATDEARQLMADGQEQAAFNLIEHAAGEGDADAIDYLGWFYDTGQVVERDLAMAERQYRKAADMGVPHAQWRLGTMMDQAECSCGSAEEAVELFEAAAAQGWTNAMLSMGVMQAGGRGTPQDFVAARASFEQAARGGNAHAFNEIGVMYMLGEGMDPDPQEALAWFIVAATYGDEVASDYLANAFRDIDVDVEEGARRAEEIVREFDLLTG